MRIVLTFATLLAINGIPFGAVISIIGKKQKIKTVCYFEYERKKTNPSLLLNNVMKHPL